MKSIISTLSARIFGNLNQDAAFYTAADLAEAGLPARLQKKLLSLRNRKFRNSIAAPQSIWLPGESDAVQNIWQNYLNDAEPHTVIPAGEMERMIELAMADLLEASCRPRKNTIGVLFSDASERTKKKLEERFANIGEHRYLGFSLLRYMDKKEMEAITKEQADALLAQIDQKITENYNALEWKRLLLPVFELGGGSVPAELIRIFFEEKGFDKTARKFDLAAGKEITDTRLVEMLSIAEWIEPGAGSEHEPLAAGTGHENTSDNGAAETEHREEFSEETDTEHDETAEPRAAEEEQAEEGNLLDLYSDGQEMDEDEKAGAEDVFFDEAENDEPDFADEDPYGALAEDTEEKEPEPLPDEPEQPETDDTEKEAEIAEDTAESDVAEDEAPEEEHEAEDDSPDGGQTLAGSFILDEDEAPEEELPENVSSEPEEPAKTLSSDIYSELNLEQEDTEFTEDGTFAGSFDEFDEEEYHEEEIFEIPEENDEEEPEDSFSEDNRDTPMWKSFLERDDEDTQSSFYFDEEEDVPSSNSSAKITPPLISLGKFSDAGQEQGAENEQDDLPDSGLDRLAAWLKDDEQRFLKELFGSSRMAYEQALIDLMVFDDWKSASKYLESEIFAKNSVDVYSQTAVEFTDKLHTYFMKQQS